MTIDNTTIETLESRYERETKRYIRFPHRIYEPLMMSAFTHRELRALLLVIRLSLGCRQKNYALVKLADFKLVGLHPSDARKTLISLECKRVIQWHRKAHTIVLNEEVVRWNVSEYSTNNQHTKQLSDLLRENLAARSSHKVYVTQREGGESPTTLDENHEESAENHTPKQTKRNQRNGKQTYQQGEKETEDAQDLWEIMTQELRVEKRIACDLLEDVDEETLWNTYRAYMEQADKVDNPAGWFVEAARKGRFADKESDDGGGTE